MSTPEEFASAWKEHKKLIEKNKKKISCLRQEIRVSQEILEKIGKQLGQGDLFSKGETDEHRNP